jgi:hypothetical protein
MASELEKCGIGREWERRSNSKGPFLLAVNQDASHAVEAQIRDITAALP